MLRDFLFMENYVRLAGGTVIRYYYGFFKPGGAAVLQSDGRFLAINFTNELYCVEEVVPAE